MDRKQWPYKLVRLWETWASWLLLTLFFTLYVLRQPESKLCLVSSILIEFNIPIGWSTQILMKLKLTWSEHTCNKENTKKLTAVRIRKLNFYVAVVCNACNDDRLQKGDAEEDSEESGMALKRWRGCWRQSGNYKLVLSTGRFHCKGTLKGHRRKKN